MGLPRTMLNLQGRAFYQLMSVSCALAFMIFGYDAGVLGGVQTTKPFLDSLKISGNEANGLIIPLIASSYTLGCLVMSIFLITTQFGYRFGRRWSILLGDILVIIGGAIQASSYSVGQICAARVICGFGIGFISATVPTYMSETTIQTKKRGPQVAIQCVYLIWGVALAYWVDLGMTQLNNSQASWRFPISLQSFFTLLSALGMLVLPDTPRWYYSQGRIEDGDKVLSMLYAQPIEAEEPQRTKADILASLQLQTDEGKIRFADWFWDCSPLQSARRVKTSFIVLALQQNMGINILVYYSTIILSKVGLDPFTQSVVAAVTNTIFAIGTLFTVPTIERWGRRPLMFWTAIGCGISMAIFIAMNGLQNPTLATQWVAVAMVIIFQFLTGWGWMGPPWLYGPEIAPLRYRHLGGAAGICGEWSMTFVTVFGGGIAVQRVGWTIWFWQLAFCVLAAIFVYIWCPETKGKTLEEIDEVFMEDAKKWPGPQLRNEHVEITRRRDRSNGSSSSTLHGEKSAQETRKETV